jgi:5-methylcytosine-specific restriction endonuclease McrA
MGNRKLKKPDSKKERNLVKGAIRRVFSRSELRKRILDAAVVKDYSDPSRKRVTRWGKCAECGKLEPAYLLEIDHKEPIIPVGQTLDDMDWDEIIDSIWCDERKLQALCSECHYRKTKTENSERRRIKKVNNEKK